MMVLCNMQAMKYGDYDVAKCLDSNLVNVVLARCEERRATKGAAALRRAAGWERSEARKIEDEKKNTVSCTNGAKECRPVTAPAVEIDAGSGDETEEWRWKKRA